MTAEAWNLFPENDAPRDPRETVVPVEKVKRLSQLSDEVGTDLGEELGNVGGVPVLWIPQVESALASCEGKKMIPVTAPKDVPIREFRKVLTAAWTSFLFTGRLNPNDISQRCQMSVERVAAIAGTESFASALELRGVQIAEVASLSPQQEAALMILTDIGSTKNFGQRLALSGISHGVFLTWMKNPRFAEAMHGIAEQITENSSIALVELGRKVGEGDLRAVQLQLEINGRHNPQQQQTVDMLMVMNKILDSLSTHLAGKPELFRLVAADMREIAMQTAQPAQAHNLLEF